MTGKKISVIIPAYNVEGYIRRCLDSLVNQTYENIEIIVVNDGSTDRTAEIVREYEEREPEKVKLFSQENKGQAEARNFGLTKAEGEYIGFVDSDDFVSTKMYELMYREAEENGCDLVTCGYYGCDDVTGEIAVYQTGYRGEFNQSIYENPLILRVNSPYPWNKLYRKELLERSGFHFQKGIIFEDLCAVFPLFMDAKKVGRVHEKLYYYIKGRKGGTISTFNEKHGQIIDALKIMNDAYLEKGKFETFYDILLFFNIRHIYARFDEMEKYENEEFKREFTERAYALLDKYFPGWRESKEYADYCEHGSVESVEEEVTEEENEEPQEKAAPRSKHGKKAKKRSEIFDQLVAEKQLEKNTVLIECYHGNDVRGAGYYIGKMLAAEGGYRIYVAAADAEKIKKFRKMHDIEWDYVDMNSGEYLEILAKAEYVINNRAFPGFYRKRKGQYFIFTDFLPSIHAQGKDVTYGAKDIQGIQFSLAQADVIPFPEECKEQLRPLLARYHMDEICRGKGVLVPVAGFFEERKEEEIKVAYMPSVRSFPGLKDAKNYLFLSELKKKLTELDEKIEEGRRVYVCFPRIIRRRFKENIWKHIDFFPEDTEPYEFLFGCQGLIGEYGSEMCLMEAVSKPVCYFADNAQDVSWSEGKPEVPGRITVCQTAGEVSDWINSIPPAEKEKLPESHSCGEFLKAIKRRRRMKTRKKVVYVPECRHREEFLEFMGHFDVEKNIFFIEKDHFDDNMAAWVRAYKPEMTYVVIIRSIVVSKKESRMIKYKLTKKYRLKEKRDKERYLGVPTVL
ncbi:MAG: bifunctional glycosyltransferase family 2 protein/CDP-glycerol:glycerophosphate glycerophosphotransferase [Roseburia sp.]|nr:bifunctional glycosyltransferase family 2 protein/CDP-glycerol:glycerophosphate glycerophosphotransferase [Roseburia sp.]